MKRMLSITLLLCSVVYAYQAEIHVAQDGSGDFTTIQAAIDETKCFPDVPITIFIQEGIYQEKVEVHAWNNRLTLKGQTAEGVIIRWGDYFKQIDRGRNSTFHTATLRVQGDEFHAENLTIENTAGPVGQALAVSVEADRCLFENCRMLGHQDTLYADGINARHHYKSCFIAGTTDFIFGGATALFEDCTIHSKANSYITAASTPEGRPYGFVFLNCKLTAAEDVTKVFLGRPWRSYAQTVFVKCDMGEHIRPEGWNNWSSKEKEKTVTYAEGGNTGPGADTSKRVSWSKQLTDEQVEAITAQEVLRPFMLPAMLSAIPRDPTYTLDLAFKKYLKVYPDIKAVRYDPATGSKIHPDLCYDKINGRPLCLDVFSSQEQTDVPQLMVVLIHGGGWSSGDRSLMHPLADYLARQGCVAVTVEYRLSPEAQYPAAVVDIKHAINWMIQHRDDYGIDPNRIVTLGCSAGAQLAGLVGLSYQGEGCVAAIVNIDGVMDFTGEEVRKSEDDPKRKNSPAARWLGGRYYEVPAKWKEASPLYYIKADSPPILFLNSSQPRFHAGRDEVIEKLNAHSIYSEVHTFDDASHCFWLFDPWFEPTGKYIVDFLNKAMGD